MDRDSRSVTATRGRRATPERAKQTKQILRTHVKTHIKELFKCLSKTYPNQSKHIQNLTKACQKQIIFFQKRGFNTKSYKQQIKS